MCVSKKPGRLDSYAPSSRGSGADRRASQTRRALFFYGAANSLQRCKASVCAVRCGAAERAQGRCCSCPSALSAILPPPLLLLLLLLARPEDSRQAQQRAFRSVRKCESFTTVACDSCRLAKSVNWDRTKALRVMAAPHPARHPSCHPQPSAALCGSPDHSSRRLLTLSRSSHSSASSFRLHPSDPPSAFSLSAPTLDPPRPHLAPLPLFIHPLRSAFISARHSSAAKPNRPRIVRFCSFRSSAAIAAAPQHPAIPSSLEPPRLPPCPPQCPLTRMAFTDPPSRIHPTSCLP